MNLIKRFSGFFLLAAMLLIFSPTANAAGGLGISPSEVSAIILQGDQADVSFQISREIFDVEESFQIALDNSSNISFPEGTLVTLAPGERTKQFHLTIDTTNLSLGDYAAQLSLQPQHGIEVEDGVVVFYGVAVNMHWQVVDVDGFTEYLVTKDIIKYSNLAVTPDAIKGAKITFDFSMQNSSTDLIKYLDYRVDLFDPSGVLIASDIVQADGTLGPYESKTFQSKFRAGSAGQNRIRVVAEYHGAVVSEDELQFTVRPKGLHEYSIMLTQLGIIVTVLVTLSIARKKKFGQFP